MSKNKEETQSILGKIWHWINYIVGLIVLAGLVYGAFQIIFGNNEKERLNLANDMIKKATRLGLASEGINPTNELVDSTASLFKNKSKKECKNSVIYYSFEFDNEIMWVKTEKDGDMISAEITEEQHPQNCVLFNKKGSKWEKSDAKPTTKTSAPQKTSNNLYSSCDGSLINLSVDTGCKYGSDTIKVEIMSQNTSPNQALYSQRFCTKGEVLTLLMGSTTSFDKNDTAWTKLDQVNPQNIKCPKIIEWLNNYGGMTMGIDENEEPLFLGGQIG
ncbi:MAG: hypothetical protein LBR70_06650 [Lactobacillaceae bacterium]|jgi:hypothetical protein|nr:hypothetical protein [Lactobacillaceae bacterium]